MARAGGSYLRKDGKKEKVAGTVDHPDGNRPRDAQGRPMGVKQAQAESGGQVVDQGGTRKPKNDEKSVL